VLSSEGFESVDARELGLGSAADTTVFEYSEKHSMVLISRDLGFSDIRKFPLRGENGMIVLRFPNELGPDGTLRELLAALRILSPSDLQDNLVILEPGSIRIRRRPGLEEDFTDSP